MSPLSLKRWNSKVFKWRYNWRGDLSENSNGDILP